MGFTYRSQYATHTVVKGEKCAFQAHGSECECLDSRSIHHSPIHELSAWARSEVAAYRSFCCCNLRGNKWSSDWTEQPTHTHPIHPNTVKKKDGGHFKTQIWSSNITFQEITDLYFSCDEKQSAWTQVRHCLRSPGSFNCKQNGPPEADNPPSSFPFTYVTRLWSVSRALCEGMCEHIAEPESAPVTRHAVMSPQAPQVRGQRKTCLSENPEGVENSSAAVNCWSHGSCGWNTKRESTQLTLDGRLFTPSDPWHRRRLWTFPHGSSKRLRNHGCCCCCTEL